MFGTSINQFSVLISAEAPLWPLWCVWGAATKLHSWATVILKHCTVNRCHFRGKAHISDSVATSNLISKKKKVIPLGARTDTQGEEFLCPWSEDEEEEEDKEQEGWNCVWPIFPSIWLFMCLPRCPAIAPIVNCWANRMPEEQILTD